MRKFRVGQKVIVKNKSLYHPEVYTSEVVVTACEDFVMLDGGKKFSHDGWELGATGRSRVLPNTIRNQKIAKLQNAINKAQEEMVELLGTDSK